jgi:hypothetical protein
VRANPDGSKVCVRDVARVALGSEEYDWDAKLSGKTNALFPGLQQWFQQIGQRVRRRCQGNAPLVVHRAGSFYRTLSLQRRQGAGVGKWVDAMVRLEGPAVAAPTALFR